MFGAIALAGRHDFFKLSSPSDEFPDRPMIDLEVAARRVRRQAHARRSPLPWRAPATGARYTAEIPVTHRSYPRTRRHSITRAPHAENHRVQRAYAGAASRPGDATAPRPQPLQPRAREDPWKRFAHPHSAFVPGSMLNRNKPDLGNPNRIDREPSGINDKASLMTKPPFQFNGTEALAVPQKNVPLPIDVQPSTERGTRIVLLTCGTSRARPALQAPRGDS